MWRRTKHRAVSTNRSLAAASRLRAGLWPLAGRPEVAVVVNLAIEKIDEIPSATAGISSSFPYSTRLGLRYVRFSVLPISSFHLLPGSRMIRWSGCPTIQLRTAAPRQSLSVVEQYRRHERSEVRTVVAVCAAPAGCAATSRARSHRRHTPDQGHILRLCMPLVARRTHSFSDVARSVTCE